MLSVDVFIYIAVVLAMNIINSIRSLYLDITRSVIVFASGIGSIIVWLIDTPPLSPPIHPFNTFLISVVTVYIRTLETHLSTHTLRHIYIHTFSHTHFLSLSHTHPLFLSLTHTHSHHVTPDKAGQVLYPLPPPTKLCPNAGAAALF